VNDEFDQALKRALGIIAKRDLFEAELRTRLAGFSAEAVDRVVHHLKGRNLLNDIRHAEHIAASRSGKRAVAADALRNELASKGASVAAIDRVGSRSNDSEAAQQLLESSFKPLPTERARAGRALARRGFELDDIESALESFFGPADRAGESRL